MYTAFECMVIAVAREFPNMPVSEVYRVAKLRVDRQLAQYNPEPQPFLKRAMLMGLGPYSVTNIIKRFNAIK